MTRRPTSTQRSALSVPALALLAVSVLACGPATIWSSAFPLRYTVVTDMVLSEGARSTESTHFSACEIVDQRDSIAANIDRRVQDDRHTFPTADGGRLLLPFLQPCRWFPSEEVPDAGVRFALHPSTADTADPTVQRLQASEGWWFDSPSRPTRMELVHSDALFDGRLPWRLRGEIGVVDGEVTRSLYDELPWLTEEAADTRARGEAAAEDPNVHPWTPREAPWRFEGVLAEVWRLEGGAACTSVAAERPSAVSAEDPCHNLPLCNPYVSRACRTLVGGLPGARSADGRTLTFDTSAPRSGWIGALTRRGELPADVPVWRTTWTPEVCLDGACFSPSPRNEQSFFADYPVVYLPARNELVVLESAIRQPQGWQLSLGRTPGT